MRGLNWFCRIAWFLFAMQLAHKHYVWTATFLFAGLLFNLIMIDFKRWCFEQPFREQGKR